MTAINAAFQWKCRPEAEALIKEIIHRSMKDNEEIAILSKELEKHTSTRLFDWIDHVSAAYTPELEKRLEFTGFTAIISAPSYRVYHHPAAQLPRVVMYDQEHAVTGVAVIVDSIADYLMVRGLSRNIEGSPNSGYRRCCVSMDNGVSLYAVERRGALTMEPTYQTDGQLESFFIAQEKWKTRPRDIHDEGATLSRAIQLAQEIVELVGEELAACIVLACERDYWQSRNQAGQVQKNRQDRLGMGWANHDHHTFRSSRRHFTQLVRLFEILGFHCRERFYAGDEAGWGAQVMENSKARLVLFLDVDLASQELEIDFAHHPLQDLAHLGTIGLWCALHSDSIIKSGMHHLEAQFAFEELTRDLATHGVGMMEPFSSFSYLKQAFTHGEIWPVDLKRIEQLYKEKKITKEQAEQFAAYGAVGSHLENLQRCEGYKGFNQKNVSFIIKKTDPRHQSKSS